MELLVSVLIGATAGWLAGNIMRQKPAGVLLNIILGIFGSFVGNWLFNLLGISASSGWLGVLITATVGACVLIIAARIFFGSKKK